MGKGFCALFKKDCRMLASGKFFLMAFGFLVLYTAYVNLGYIRFMQMEPYNVYLYDPAGTQTEQSSLVQTVPSMEAMDTALLSDANGVGLDASGEEVRVVLYRGAEHVDRHRADYALSLLEPSASPAPEVLGTNTPEQKARKEITCELLFFELAAVGFLGIAAVLFKEKGMGVIRVHAILPVRKDLFLLSKLAVFLLSDLAFAVLLTLLNVGLNDGAAVLPAVLLQTAILSLMMALVGLLCALLLKDFRQFTLAYLVIAIFAATPVFLSANTSIKLDWIGYHPFYHVYMGLKNAYFGTDISPAYYAGAAGVIALLFLVVQLAFHREIGKEG
ncbi:ABC transporter permease [Lawsonibacter sp. JLR.KK007]|uniref:ABC transporter permease n=1 Tax=Lawsonibacter sp. JLR.KK007 TaxID=3114293 RepID=UPI002FEE71D3